MRWLLILLVACEKPTPTCEEIERHAVANIRIAEREKRPLLVDATLETRLTAEDGRYLRAKCEAWPADYRRCVGNRFDVWVPCGGPSDVDWFLLPHVDAHRKRLLDLELEIASVLSERLFDLGFETGKLQGELAALAPKDTQLRAQIELALGTLRERVTQTEALKAGCLKAPLEKPECVAVLPAAKR